MNNSPWILKNGSQTIDCVSFPYAFRTAFHIFKKGLESKQNLSSFLNIYGPPSASGDRRKYSYAAAEDLARSQGLLTPDGQINSKEFKKK